MKIDISKKNYVERYQQYIDFEEIIQNEYLIIGKIFAETISTTFKAERKIHVLDVGCGTGRMPKTLMTLLDDAGINLIFDFLDPVEDALAIYEQNVPSEYRGARILGDWNLFQPDKRYDVILANNSLCGLDTNEMDSINRFRRLLKKNGISLITLPSIESEWVKYPKLLWPSVHQEPFAKTIFEDITSKLDKLAIVHEDQFVKTSVNLDKEDYDTVLKTVFAVMMYVNREEIDSRYNTQYNFFKEGISGEKDLRLDFVYGITKIKK